jgi:hypothetical protein
MIVLNAGGKGKQALGAGRKKSPRRMSRWRETSPPPTFFTWDRGGQRHEAIEQGVAAEEDQQQSQRSRSSPWRPQTIS